MCPSTLISFSCSQPPPLPFIPIRRLAKMSASTGIRGALRIQHHNQTTPNTPPTESGTVAFGVASETAKILSVLPGFTASVSRAAVLLHGTPHALLLC